MLRSAVREAASVMSQSSTLATYQQTRVSLSYGKNSSKTILCQIYYSVNNAGIGF